MEYTVRSSHGELTVDKDGYVTWRHIDDRASEGGSHLALITRFDLVEWRHHWNDPEGDSIDILDIGYWYNNPKTNSSTYIEPDADWRKDIAESLFRRKPACRVSLSNFICWFHVLTPDNVSIHRAPEEDRQGS